MSSTTGIDFSTLSLRDALDLAVLIEEEARDRYEEFAEQLELHHTPEAAKFFREMAGNEEKHRSQLAARRRISFGGEASTVTRAMIFDVEAPDYDEARAFMTVRSALEAAMRAEEKAYDFFAAAIPNVQDDEVRSLFEELRDEETEHKRMVAEQLEKAPADPEIDEEAFGDDPVSH